MNKKVATKMIKGSGVESIREEFRKYFVGLKRKLKLAPELENAIWLHLKATGNDSKEKFEEGTRHFGYKI